MDKRTQLLIDRYKEYIDSREVFFNYLEDYETFSSSILKHSRPILLEYNTAFNFERKGNNREGALTQKNLKEKIAGIHLLVKVVKVRKDIEFPLQIHTFFHELAHLVNNHNDQEMNHISLSTAQKEYVAEVTAQALLYSFVGGMKVEELPSNEKWDQSTYIYNWIKNAKFSDEKIDEMWKQIEFAYEKISNTILEKTNKKTQD